MIMNVIDDENEDNEGTKFADYVYLCKKIEIVNILMTTMIKCSYQF